MQQRHNPFLRIIIVSIVSALILQAPLTAHKERRGATVAKSGANFWAWPSVPASAWCTHTD